MYNQEHIEPQNHFVAHYAPNMSHYGHSIISLSFSFFQNEPAPNSTCPEGLVYLPITGVNVNYTDPDDMMTTACANLNESSTSCLFSVSLTEDDSLNQKEFSVSVEVTDGKRVNVSSPSQFKCESVKIASLYIIKE